MSACEDNQKKDETLTPDSTAVEPEVPSPELPLPEFTIIEIGPDPASDPEPPLVITLPTPPTFHPEGAHLSTWYDENYSGYWRNNSCGGLRFARIGINGMSVEIYTGISGVDNMFGTIDSSGELSFPEREVSLSCEECDDIRPLRTDGDIDFILKSGLLNLEQTCSNSSIYEISDANVKLKEGSTQARPDNEMYRIESDIKELSKNDLECDADNQCKIISLKVNDLCNSYAIVYSSLSNIEDTLYDLKNEYNINKWLHYGSSNGSSLTLCAGRRQPMCELNTCVLSDYL